MDYSLEDFDSELLNWDEGPPSNSATASFKDSNETTRKLEVNQPQHLPLMMQQIPNIQHHGNEVKLPNQQSNSQQNEEKNTLSCSTSDATSSKNEGRSETQPHQPQGQQPLKFASNVLPLPSEVSSGNPIQEKSQTPSGRAGTVNFTCHPTMTAAYHYSYPGNWSNLQAPTATSGNSANVGDAQNLFPFSVAPSNLYLPPPPFYLTDASQQQQPTINQSSAVPQTSTSNANTKVSQGTTSSSSPKTESYIPTIIPPVGMAVNMNIGNTMSTMNDANSTLRLPTGTNFILPQPQPQPQVPLSRQDTNNVHLVHNNTTSAAGILSFTQHHRGLLSTIAPPNNNNSNPDNLKAASAAAAAAAVAQQNSLLAHSFSPLMQAQLAAAAAANTVQKEQQQQQSNSASVVGTGAANASIEDTKVKQHIQTAKKNSDTVQKSIQSQISSPQPLGLENTVSFSSQQQADEQLRFDYMQHTQANRNNLPASFQSDNDPQHQQQQQQQQHIQQPQPLHSMSVPGFHPSQLMSTNNFPQQESMIYQMLDNTRSKTGRKTGGVPSAAAGTTSGNSSGKGRNEREQKRAQKISDLIESLRLSMVESGWKVEVKSKYHTLSKCTDYVKHLIALSEERDKELQEAKKIQEKIMSDDSRYSDSSPEHFGSVTSSLTSDSGHKDDLHNIKNESSKSSKKARSNNLSLSTNEDKEQKYGSTPENSNSDGSDENNEKHEKPLASAKNEKRELSSYSGSYNGGEINNSSTKHAISSISYKKISSSVSEMTGSNTSSSKSKSGNDPIVTQADNCFSTNDNKNNDDTDINQLNSNKGQRSVNGEDISSVLSTAAVASVTSRQAASEKDGTQVRRKKRKKVDTKLWITDSGRLSYEEVFLTSNIPQIIATHAGRIITWNTCFLKATGLTSHQAKRLTLFSIVQSDKLSKLFEIVSASLRDAKLEYDGNVTKEHQREDRSFKRDHTSYSYDPNPVTLPCIPFPSNSDKHQEGAHPHSFFMTVSLMYDEEDELKSCLHCMLTDTEGKNGKMGSISPELLKRIFSSSSFQCNQTNAASTSNKLTPSSPSRKFLTV